MGMQCHEFGIRPMAEAVPGIGREEESFRGVPFPVPGLEGRADPAGFASMNSNSAKQADHVLGVIAYKTRLSGELPLDRQPIKPLFPLALGLEHRHHRLGRDPAGGRSGRVAGPVRRRRGLR
jgi:hypothetical protein